MHERAKRGVDHVVSGDPVAAGNRTLQPVARVRGRRGAGGAGAGAFLRVEPREVIVGEPDGEQHRVVIADPAAEAIQGMLRGAVVVAAVCWAVIAGVWWRRRSCRSGASCRTSAGGGDTLDGNCSENTHEEV